MGAQIIQFWLPMMRCQEQLSGPPESVMIGTAYTIDESLTPGMHPSRSHQDNGTFPQVTARRNKQDEAVESPPAR
jgi:hypothetical protein